MCSWGESSLESVTLSHPLHSSLLTQPHKLMRQLDVPRATEDNSESSMKNSVTAGAVMSMFVLEGPNESRFLSSLTINPAAAPTNTIATTPPGAAKYLLRIPITGTAAIVRRSHSLSLLIVWGKNYGLAMLHWRSSGEK